MKLPESCEYDRPRQAHLTDVASAGKSAKQARPSAGRQSDVSKVPRPGRHVCKDYLPPIPKKASVFVTGGGFHLPVSASDFGA